MYADRIPSERLNQSRGIPIPPELESASEGTSNSLAINYLSVVPEPLYKSLAINELLVPSERPSAIAICYYLCLEKASQKGRKQAALSSLSGVHLQLFVLY